MHEGVAEGLGRGVAVHNSRPQVRSTVEGQNRRRRAAGRRAYFESDRVVPPAVMSNVRQLKAEFDQLIEDLPGRSEKERADVVRTDLIPARSRRIDHAHMHPHRLDTHRDTGRVAVTQLDDRCPRRSRQQRSSPIKDVPLECRIVFELTQVGGYEGNYQAGSTS
jgi:hypothetical protein